MKYIAKVKDKSFNIEISEADGKMKLNVNGEPIKVDSVELKNHQTLSVLVNNKSFDVEINRDTESFWVWMKGKKYQCFLEDEKLAKIKSLAGFKVLEKKEKQLKSPMPGLVVGVEVKEGDWVKAGQGLVIVEAMKMENELKAQSDAKIKKILIKPNQTVEKDEVLLVFE